MPNSSMPSTRMKEINAIEDIARTYEAMLPKQFSGGINLFIHPMAGVIAMSSLGFGMASHAFGLWMGMVAGASEASRRMLEDASETDAVSTNAKRRAKPKLEIVSSSAPPQAAAATLRTTVAEAGRVTAAVTRTARSLAEEANRDARKATEAAERIAASMEKSGKVHSAKPKAIAKPDVVDDLKAISGIGPKLEQMLHGLGIWTYEQIAVLSEAEIAWLDNEFGFAGRIVRDDWTGQAERLAAAK